ncbi:Endonuclease/exonuclease/phosphatase [Phycomyces nitens]|nr:Endonuclease/exonuclease/phosphatase [Phycomyces nitens]
MSVKDLSVLTLNCWGLYLVAKQRKIRLRAIADALSNENHDIITLQEIWMLEDFEYLKTKVKHVLPFANYYYSGALGSGLAILSRFPIVSTSYFRYTLAGRPLKIFHGDYYVGKGCASACINHPDIGIIEVFTTHLHAGYGDVDEYEGHRVTESWELSNLLRASAAQGRQVIATGDFNSIPTSYNYALLKKHAFMTDAWLEVHSKRLSQTGLDPGHRSPLECIQHLGITCDSPVNTWSKHFLKQQPHSKQVGDRLDYIFYRSTPQLICTGSVVAMTECIPGTQMCYSDHFGVQATFSLNPSSTQVNYSTPSAIQLSNPSFTAFPLSIAQAVLTLLRRDQAATRKTAFRLLFLFFVTVFTLLSLCAITVVVLPSWIGPKDKSQFKFVLGSLASSLVMIVSAVVATICVVVGFVFGHTEERALRQFIEEIELLVASIQEASRSNGSFGYLMTDQAGERHSHDELFNDFNERTRLLDGV